MDYLDDDMPNATEFADDYYGDDADAATDGDVFADEANCDDEVRSDKKNYTILAEPDIRRLQDDDVSQLSATLSISKSDSCMLLRHYNWNVGKVHDEWFADEAKVREDIGLIENPAALAAAADESVCGICFDRYPRGEMGAANCGHQFCRDCWRGYISTSIGDGPGCLALRCPDPLCSAAVRKDMVDSLVCDEDKERYSRYLLRSYVEDNKKAKWCPGRGCEFAVSFDVDSENYNVFCRCGHAFCWNCVEEAHRPVDCEMVKKWILKNSAESENTNWILANSKPCPKCQRPIEKNQGCMHMACRPPCGFNFCWLCMGSWSDHGRCNRYQEGNQGGEPDEEERRRKRAKVAIERYTHYWERWAANQKSMNKAIADLENILAEKLEKLGDKLNLPESQVKFITEAWEQIVECRRVLTWTYAYGYYLDEKEVAKREFFEYLQGEAEAGLERLHRSAEIDLEVYFDRNCTLSGTSKEFVDFRSNLAGLTTVTRNYFENLVRALENGLQEVDSWTARWNEAKNKGAGKIAPYGRTITYADYADYAGDEDGFWACITCTYVNSIAFDSCEVCETDRYK